MRIWLQSREIHYNIIIIRYFLFYVNVRRPFITWTTQRSRHPCRSSLRRRTHTWRVRGAVERQEALAQRLPAHTRTKSMHSAGAQRRGSVAAAPRGAGGRAGHTLCARRGRTRAKPRAGLPLAAAPLRLSRRGAARCSPSLAVTSPAKDTRAAEQYDERASSPPPPRPRSLTLSQPKSHSHGARGGGGVKPVCAGG